jgi:hypothetical protein
VDESREQTRSIHQLQRHKRTLEGLLARARKNEILAVHRNAQRLLRPLGVLNPYANRLTFPDTATRLRRDHEKYLTLIDTIALLHQMSREVKAVRQGEKLIEYVEVQLSDIALANALAHEVLGRSLDELPPQTRRVLLMLDRFVTERARAQGIERSLVRFSRRELREHAGISDTQLRLHLDRLVLFEYLLVHRGGRGQSFVYELVYDGAGQDGAPFVPGLIDVGVLGAAATTANLAGLKGEFAGQNEPLAGLARGQCGPNAPGSRPAQNALSSCAQSASRDSSEKASDTHCSGAGGENAVVPLAAAPGA